MPAETFSAAKARLLAQLAQMGWTVRSQLKVPWAEPPSHAYRIWFKPQAVYLNEHSLFMDIRGMPAATFMAHVDHAVVVATRYASRLVNPHNPRSTPKATRAASKERLLAYLQGRGMTPEQAEREYRRLTSYNWANAEAPHFQISARATRGGWRGVATLGGGVVAMKTVPIFRSKDDAEKAIRAWLKGRGAHADRRRRRRKR